MFKVKHNICPPVLSNVFLENKNVHNFCTRQPDNKLQMSMYMEIFNSVHKLWSLVYILQNRYS